MKLVEDLKKERSYSFSGRHVGPFIFDLIQLSFFDILSRRRRQHAINFARSARGYAFEARSNFPTVKLGELLKEIGGQEVTSVVMPPPDYVAKAGLGGPWPYYILGALVRAKQPRRIFEIGTFRGVSALTFALNSDERCEIYTLDLPGTFSSDDVKTLTPGDKEWAKMASDSVGIAFQNRPEKSKITQFRANSMTFDAVANVHSADFCFVDGGHSFECISKDTENALSVLQSGGVLIWDDYAWFMESVQRFLNELAEHLPLRRIENSQYVVYLKP